MAVPAKPTIDGTAWMSGIIGIIYGTDSSATSMKIKRSTTPGGPYTQIATGTIVRDGGGNITQTQWSTGQNLNGPYFTNGSVSNGTTYYYVYVATNADGDSPESDEASETALSQSSNSSFVSQDIPATMVVGESYSGTVTFQNTGTKPWQKIELVRAFASTANDFGVSRMLLGDGDTITNGQNGTFTATFTAPLTPGTYQLQFGTNVEAVGEFGDESPILTVNVIEEPVTPPPPPPPPPVNSAGVHYPEHMMIIPGIGIQIL